MRACAEFACLHSWTSRYRVRNRRCLRRDLCVSTDLTKALQHAPLNFWISIIIHTLPLRKRSTYAGLGAAMEAAASLVAPLLGGLLTDKLSWRWCFFIQLPLIAALIAIIVFFLDMSVGQAADSLSVMSVLRKSDILGTAIFVPAISLLILALQWGGQRYEWSDWRVILPICLFVALFALFIWHQSRLGQLATVPLHILRRRNVLFGFLFSFCNNGSLNIVEYYVRIASTITGLR